MKKKNLIIIICVILILVGGFLFYYLGNNKKKEVKNSKNRTKIHERTIKKDQLYTIDDVKKDDKKYKVDSKLQASSSEGVYERLFDKNEIKDIKIKINENNLTYLLENAINKPTVLADSITINQDTIKYVGIKTKGNSSLNGVWSKYDDKFSFTINFGKYINKNNGYSEKQNMYGLRKVALNNMYADATMLREYLSYSLLEEMGVDAPYYSIVKLYINDKYWGYYFMVESIDSALTERTISDKSDCFIKPQSKGGDLVYHYDLEEYYNNNEFNFDSIIHDNNGNIIYPNPKNPLYNYSGLWENDEENFKDIVDFLPKLFKWLRELNELNNAVNKNTVDYKNRLEEIINVDDLIRYFAVNTYMVNLDSYVSNKMQNYGLFISNTGKAQIYPWDYNYSFGSYGIKNINDKASFDIYNPVFGVKLTDRPLLNVILNNDDYKKLYEQYLKDICIIVKNGGTTSDNKKYKENNFISIIEEFSNNISKEYSSIPNTFYNKTEYSAEVSRLKRFIDSRTDGVLKQIER